MLFHKHFKMLFIVFFVIVISLTITSCSKDDDPLSPSEEHFEAIGMVIYDASGKMTVKILRGETTDTLNAETGKRSDHFTVKFYNEDEVLVDAPEDEHHSFAAQIDDITIAKLWQHEGEEGGFEFHIDGLKSGITNIEFFIEHEGHADYRTGKIPLKVSE